MELYNITIDQGATFTLSITYKDPDGVPINLTGYTAQMQIRKSPRSPSYMLSISDSDGIVLGGSAGTIDITITDEQTSILDPADNYFYDLKLTSAGGIATRLIGGSVTVTAEVTR